LRPKSPRCGPASFGAAPAILLRSIVFCYCLFLAGCYSGRGTEDPAASASLLPLGVMTPSSDGSGAFTGIVPSKIPGDPNCCWIGRTASFQVRVPANARALILTVFVPDLKSFQNRSQSIAVSVDRGSPHRFEHLPTGPKTLRVPLARQSTVRVSSVVLRARFTVSPKKAHLSNLRYQPALYLTSAKAR